MTQGQPQCCCQGPPDEECYQFCAYPDGTPIAWLVTFPAGYFTGPLAWLNGQTIALDLLKFDNNGLTFPLIGGIANLCMWYYCGPDEDNPGKFIQIVMYGPRAGFPNGSGAFGVILSFEADECPTDATASVRYIEWGPFIDPDLTGCGIDNTCDDVDCCALDPMEMFYVVSTDDPTPPIDFGVGSPSVVAEECF